LATNSCIQKIRKKQIAQDSQTDGGGPPRPSNNVSVRPVMDGRLANRWGNLHPPAGKAGAIARIALTAARTSRLYPFFPAK